jgi:hypothetical protein
MKKLVLRIIALPAVAAVAFLLVGFSSRQSQAPVITGEPEDQMVLAGSAATLAVQADNGAAYQWLRNGFALTGQTKPTLAFEQIEIKDAGNYSCIISGGAKTVATRIASLMVYVRRHAGSTTTTIGDSATPMSSGDPITLYAYPVSSSGSSGGCPGNYAGYVMYSKTFSQGWGWTPIAGAPAYSATDVSGRTDTSIQYGGRSGDNGCNQTSVTIPGTPPSSAYRFAIYFPSNVPATNYPITLTGFNP